MICLHPSAQDLAKEQKVNYGDDIACVIRVARKRRFNVAEEKRISQEIELQVKSSFVSHCNIHAVLYCHSEKLCCLSGMMLNCNNDIFVCVYVCRRT